ncbi:MAG: hypothetical protein AB7R89_13755 [Dehalococcoidia bacterium]
MTHSTGFPETDAYQAFLARKAIVVPSVGIEVDESDLPAAMFPWQRAVTRWALRKGRCAIFANTGLGKTIMQLAWAQQAAEHTLILAPLAVARQTVREGERWGIPVTYARSMDESPAHGITITNYEMTERFDAGAFGAVVLDESSILKAHDGKTRGPKRCRGTGEPCRVSGFDDSRRDVGQFLRPRRQGLAAEGARQRAVLSLAGLVGPEREPAIGPRIQ